MRVLIAFDKFKDCMTAQQACDITRDTLSEIQPNWELEAAPLADGGDGFVEILTAAADGTLIEITVSGPRGQETQANYGIVESNCIPTDALGLLNLPNTCRKIALVEIAQSSGIALLSTEDRNPWKTSTNGLGQVLEAAAKKADAIVIGLGGSSTNDLALGALQHLGFVFLDQSGIAVDDVSPENWHRISSISAADREELPPLRIACDVTNPLLGPQGATRIFGPQKGLVETDFDRMETEVERVASLLAQACEKSSAIMDEPSGGAAGGAGFGLRTALDGQFISGFNILKSWIQLDSKFDQADIIITGEGRFDESSFQGKGPGTLAQKSIDKRKPAFVFAGSLDQCLEPSRYLEVHAITPETMDLPRALTEGANLLETAIRKRFQSYEKQST